MILVYGDDSEDEKNERVVAVSGVVGTIPAWRALEREWVVRTAGIPFHANLCESDQGPYKDFPHAENKALYKDLVAMPMMFEEVIVCRRRLNYGESLNSPCLMTQY